MKNFFCGKYGPGYFFVCLMVFLGLMICPASSHWRFLGVRENLNASASGLMISQVMIGQDGAANNEFIEIYNSSGGTIDLSGYSLKKKTQSGSESTLVSAAKFAGVIPAGGFFLIAHPNYKDLISADLAYSGSSYSISANNTLLLYDSEGNLLDKAGFGEAGDFETAAATGLENGKSLIRKTSGGAIIDSDNNLADFLISENPQPRNTLSPAISADENTDTAGDSENNDENNNTLNPGSGGGASNPEAAIRSILINEFVSDPADEEKEWVELYLKINGEIDLSGWTLEDGSGAKTALSGVLNAGNRFLVIESPKGSLNNSGDKIILRDPKKRIIDQIIYGKWTGTETEKNAPAPSDPQSSARSSDGYWTGDHAKDFVLTAEPTKGSSNIIDVDNNSAETVSTENKSAKAVQITEILPNPTGADSEIGGEFIEIYNPSENRIDMRGWTIQLSTGQAVKMETCVSDTLIGASGCVVVNNRRCGLVLPNSGATIKLFGVEGKAAVQSVTYKAAAENESYESDGKKWKWNSPPNPGRCVSAGLAEANGNMVVEIDIPEKIEAGKPAIFDASDTIEVNGKKLNFAWDFGDGLSNNLSSPSHVYLKPGKYTVKLSVNNGVETATKEKVIEVERHTPDPSREGSLGDTTADNASLAVNNKGLVWISEILPDPKGSDDEEWVEIYNSGETKVDLSGWRLADTSKTGYKFKDAWIDPAGYFLLDRADSKIALNNTAEKLSLFDLLDNLISEIEYSKAIEGESFARGENGQYFWTTVLTPGEPNVIKISDSENVIAAAMNSVSATGNSGKMEEFFDASLEELFQLEAGEKVRVRGIVAVLPGILGSQFFYISGSSGAQVYNYQKDFPELSVGDLVEVSGELSQANGETRIKTKVAADMKIISSGAAPEPEETDSREVGGKLGCLVSVSGEVVDKKSATLIVDDGVDEIVVYVKKETGISLASVKEGDKIAVTGIVGGAKTGARLLPREPADILISGSEMIEQEKERTATAENRSPQVLGEISFGSEWELEPAEKSNSLIYYLIIILGGGAVVSVGTIIRKRKDKRA